MERPKVEPSDAPNTQPRSDVQFSYGTDDNIVQYGLRLTPTHETANFPEGAPLPFDNTPVLVTRGSANKGPKGPLVCHVEGCQRDLSLEKKYYKRYRVCMEHLKMSAIYVDGELQRFCQQCGRFHDLEKFDGDKRNCRERLSQHNRRRRKSKRETGGSDGSWDDFGQDTPAGKALKGRRSKRIVQTDASSLWSGNYDGTHGMTTEEQNVLGSVGMQMMQGIPVGASGSAALHPFGDAMALSPEGQSSVDLVLRSVLSTADQRLNQEIEHLCSSVHEGIELEGVSDTPNHEDPHIHSLTIIQPAEEAQDCNHAANEVQEMDVDDAVVLTEELFEDLLVVISKFTSRNGRINWSKDGVFKEWEKEFRLTRKQSIKVKRRFERTNKDESDGLSFDSEHGWVKKRR